MLRLALALAVAASAQRTELQRYVSRDDAREIRALVSKRADINARGSGGQTPIMSAALGGHLKALEALLELGADTTIGEDDGYTPFHGAGFQGQAEIARALHRYGLDPLDMHSDGYIGMHRACWGREQRHTDTVRAFVEMGVDLDFKAKNGKTCEEMTHNQETKKYLQDTRQQKADQTSCNVKTMEGCTDKEKAYVEKKREQGKPMVEAEIKRLKLYRDTPEAPKDLDRRMKLLEKLRHEL